MIRLPCRSSCNGILRNVIYRNLTRNSSLINYRPVISPLLTRQFHSVNQLYQHNQRTQIPKPIQYSTKSTKPNDNNNNNNDNEHNNESHNSTKHTPLHKKRPTKEELLAAASGALERLKIRFKWSLIRQVRPFNMDDISGMFSWILVGNLIWILLGTTTFCSLVLFTMNTVSAQDTLARWVGNFLTQETGLTVVFENAIVPHWKDGVISFNNVFVSKRPGNKKSSTVSKGSQARAAAAAKNAAYDEEYELLSEKNNKDDGNYTQFDLTIDQVSVTLSFSKWMDGRGFLQDVEVKGIRGVVDRSHVQWKENDDPKEYKNVHHRGDFEIDNFKMEDALVTLYQPGGMRAFDVSIFNCDLPQLRKHWLLYDILNANNMSGSFDNSLFTIHPRQMTKIIDEDSNEPWPWKKINRLRIDGVNVEHLNRGVDGPFGWIESGDVDFMVDLMLPVEADHFNLSEVVQDIVERWDAQILSRNKTSNNITTSVEERKRELKQHKYVVMDIRVQLNNTRAAVPIFTGDLTYINNALIRPIVAYINSRNTYIPINCRVVKKLVDFEGSWTIYDSELMDDVSAEVYEAFARNVIDDETRALRMRKVGFWSLQFAAQLLLLGLGAIA